MVERNSQRNWLPPHHGMPGAMTSTHTAVKTRRGTENTHILSNPRSVVYSSHWKSQRCCLGCVATGYAGLARTVGDSTVGRKKPVANKFTPVSCQRDSHSLSRCMKNLILKGYAVNFIFYLSVSWTESAVISLYCGTLSFISMQTFPTNAR